MIVVGPTASGKSGLAMSLAAQWPMTIVSADSRQIYKAFDIGTAKPTWHERQQVPHHFVDICEPTDILTVADYQQQAQTVIDEMHRQGTRIPLLVGGTGLYVNAIAKGLKIPRVAPQQALRTQLQGLGQSQCYQLLKQVDASAGDRIHPNDQVRTLRALEVYYVTGKPISSQQGEQPPNYPILYIGLTCEPAVLRERITRRTHQMVEAGFVAEVAHLMKKYGTELPLLKTLGYAEMQQHLTGELSLEEAITLTVQHTCQFAKRQRTWFQKEPRIEWFTAGEPQLETQVARRVEQFLQATCS
ncbi:MAG: tRNA (adenosine(37)-N6)-dimethylallyltransferase MiaA [Cyanobacteria bacterium J06626_6]